MCGPCHRLHALAARLGGAAGRFVRGTRGTIAVETVIVLPLLIFALFGMVTLWDSQRAVNSTVKATGTVADMLSRQQAPVSGAMIRGLAELHRFATRAEPGQSWLRVTSVRWEQATNRHVVLWSFSTSTAAAPLTTATVAGLRPRLPVMADADTLLIIEAWRQFTPLFATPLYNTGLGPRTIYEMAAVRPRYLSPLPFGG